MRTTFGTCHPSLFYLRQWTLPTSPRLDFEETTSSIGSPLPFAYLNRNKSERIRNIGGSFPVSWRLSKPLAKMSRACHPLGWHKSTQASPGDEFLGAALHRIHYEPSFWIS